jgi:hypothetical protein
LRAWARRGNDAIEDAGERAREGEEKGGGLGARRSEPVRHAAYPTEHAAPLGQTTHWSALVMIASDWFLCVPPGQGSAAAAASEQ